MRIYKLFSAVCSAAFLAGSPAVRAQDNPATPAVVAAPSGALMAQAGQPTTTGDNAVMTPANKPVSREDKAKAKAEKAAAAADLKAKKEADRKAAKQKAADEAAAKAQAKAKAKADARQAAAAKAQAGAPGAAPAVKPPTASGFQPVEAPPPPVSAQKEAKLQALLAKYMANQVSPEEYQKERTAILAEP